MLSKQTLFITRGTGLFGNALYRQLLKTGIGEVRIFNRNEKKQDDLRHHWGDKRLRFNIGNMCGYHSFHDELTETVNWFKRE